MVDSTSDGSSGDDQDAVARAAHSLSSLSEEQIVQLVADLLEERKKSRESSQAAPIEQVRSRVPAQEPVPEREATPGPTLGRNWGTRSWKWLAARGAALVGLFAAGRSLVSEKDFWRICLANTIPFAIALPLSLLIAPYAFERDRAAAEPKISIEYALISRDSQLLTEKAVEMIADTSRQPIYRSFVVSRIMSGSTANVGSFNMQGARLSAALHEKLLAEIAAFHEHLNELRDQVSVDKAELEGLDDSELQRFAFRVMEDPSRLDASAPRAFLLRELNEKVARIDELLTRRTRLLKELSGIPSSIRVRLTLLNRGATDGLVRHEGELTYRGIDYAIRRTAPPGPVLESTAIPVFQTNAVVNEYSATSVGKIERDSMSEFWYEFRLNAGSKIEVEDKLCQSSELIKVTLYDHNRDHVQSTLECNEGES